jgi:4-hydroxy-4-methyl-2-oxoglutarate aldolase
MSNKMNVDQLQRERDTVDAIELPIPDAEICERYEKLYTGAVNDVMREFCMPLQALPPTIRPLRNEMVLAGFAFTIRSTDDPTLGGELDQRVQMLDEIKPNHVCVWNHCGRDVASHWGGVMTRASLKRGCRGAIVDGGIRDTKDILEQGLPIWYRYRTSTGALSHSKMVAWQQPVFVGGVIIKPGDLIMADIDGALAIPRKMIVDVLERAEQIERNEGEIKEWVDAGLSAADISERGGYF